MTADAAIQVRWVMVDKTLMETWRDLTHEDQSKVFAFVRTAAGPTRVFREDARLLDIGIKNGATFYLSAVTVGPPPAAAAGGE